MPYILVVEVLVVATFVVGIFGANDLSIVHNVHWGLLHYHKTGHDLALSLLTPFKPPQCKKTTLGHVPKSTDLSLSLKTFFKNDISMLTGGFLQFNWKKTLSNENHHVRIVHFVRDPYDMVMSGYLYHSQQRAPVSLLNNCIFVALVTVSL